MKINTVLLTLIALTTNHLLSTIARGENKIVNYNDFLDNSLLMGEYLGSAYDAKMDEFATKLMTFERDLKDYLETSETSARNRNFHELKKFDDELEGCMSNYEKTALELYNFVVNHEFVRTKNTNLAITYPGSVTNSSSYQLALKSIIDRIQTNFSEIYMHKIYVIRLLIEINSTRN